MELLAIFILAAIALWVILAVRAARRGKCSGCGSCSGCAYASGCKSRK